MTAPDAPVAPDAPDVPGIVTLGQVRRDAEVVAFIAKADHNLDVLGYTEHSERHAAVVAGTARRVLAELGYPERRVELGEIAGFLHDIGNAVTRLDHGIAAALIARDVLRRLGMPIDEYADVMAAIGNHEEDYGEPISDIAAAVILGDKSDVHKTRVRNPDPHTFDIHDRVNLASQRADVLIDREARTIVLDLQIDTTVSQVMNYFEIFLTRMVMCRRAASFLGCEFGLVINGTRLL